MASSAKLESENFNYKEKKYLEEIEDLHKIIKERELEIVTLRKSLSERGKEVKNSHNSLLLDSLLEAEILQKRLETGPTKPAGVSSARGRAKRRPETEVRLQFNSIGFLGIQHKFEPE